MNKDHDETRTPAEELAVAIVDIMLIRLPHTNAETY
jgi:hypothetical protein